MHGAPVDPADSASGGPTCPRCQGAMDPQRASYADDGTLICASCQGHSAAAAASHAARRGAAQEQVNTVLVAMIGVGALIAISGCCWISMLFRNSVH